MKKTSLGLVEYARAQLGRPYWYGTFGNTATAELYAAKKKQYPSMYKSWSDFPKQYGSRVHDCVGLIKGYLWSESTDSKPIYNVQQDVSANGMRSACKEKGDIETMPDIPGVLVFMNGHVGVYIGNGYVIEARGHQYGVVMIKLSSRPWKHWGKCPWVDYENKTVNKITVKSGSWNIRKGPGTNFGIIKVIKGETVIESSKKDEKSGWYYVDGIGGWISYKAIK